MARVKNINRYPLAAYSQLFEEAREWANRNQVFGITCSTYKEAEARRFELYAFIRALLKSQEPEHIARAKEYQGFKLVLFKTGINDQTSLQFQSYDNTGFAIDIMKQVQLSREKRKEIFDDSGAPAPVPPQTLTIPAQNEAQSNILAALGYGKKETGT
ncbi:MAG: hypothetical protein ACYC1K_03505 [Minisyncoccota bacterium]